MVKEVVLCHYRQLSLSEVSYFERKCYPHLENRRNTIFLCYKFGNFADNPNYQVFKKKYENMNEC